MKCDCCRRDVDYVRGSFWHGEARICRECFAQWYDPDNDRVGTDTASIGNYVRLKHGLPPIAAALALLALALTSTAEASRRCLDHAEAARTWPTRVLVRDGDGCWTYDHRPARPQLPNSTPETITLAREPALMERWPDIHLAQIELLPVEPGPVSEAKAPEGIRHFALFLSLVLAVVSVIKVAAGQQANSARLATRPSTDRRASWASKA
jgi:hypothetical protein